jgi:hypothetical protein
MKLFEWWVKILENQLMRLPYFNFAQRQRIKSLMEFSIEDAYQEVLLGFWRNAAHVVLTLSVCNIVMTVVGIAMKTVDIAKNAAGDWEAGISVGLGRDFSNLDVCMCVVLVRQLVRDIQLDSVLRDLGWRLNMDPTAESKTNTTCEVSS